MILGNLIIKTSRDVMEFPLKVHLTRKKTWLYLWRSATGHLLTFFYATSTQWRCASVIPTAKAHAIVLPKRPEIARNIWMRSSFLRKRSRKY